MNKINQWFFLAIGSVNLTACTPRIQLETPEEGITINMNVVVDHKIEVKMDKQSQAIIQTSDNRAVQSVENEEKAQ